MVSKLLNVGFLLESWHFILRAVDQEVEQVVRLSVAGLIPCYSCSCRRTRLNPRLTHLPEMAATTPLVCPEFPHWDQKVV